MPTGHTRRLAAALACLAPASFALVMATGIVADATHRLGIAGLPRVLLWYGAGTSAILAVLYVTRLILFPARVLEDLRHAVRAPDFLTLPAASCVLGGELVLLEASPTAGAVLWLLAIATWIVLVYAVLVVLMVRREKRGLGRGFDGNWLLLVVAPQAIAVLGAILADHGSTARDLVLDVAVSHFLLGALLYVALFPLLLHRLVFFPIDAATLTPPHWLAMGASAITTFAGSLLVHHAALSPLLAQLRPLLFGLTLLFWAAATFWIPLLVLLGGWRHLVERQPLRYSTEYWAVVFPLGMYAVASFRLHDDVGWPLLVVFGDVFGYASLAAWALATLGLTRAIHRSLFETSRT